MKYPVAKIQPVSVTFGRVSYVDAYQWLEEDSVETLQWQAAQDRLAQDWLGERPSQARARSLVESMPRFTHNFPSYAGGRWFRKRVPQGRNLEVIEMAERIEGPWRLVVDLNRMTTGEPLSLDNFAPSPDGRRLLFGWGVGGRELAELRVIDVDSGEVLLDGIRQLRPQFPAWFNDGSGFYYTAMDPAEPGIMKVYRQPLGLPAVEQPEDYEASHSVMWAKAAGDGRHFLMIANHLNPRPDYLREGSADGAWKPFLKGETALFRGGIIGDRYYAITDDGAKRGRVVSIPLATPGDRSTWKELVSGSDDVLCTLLVVERKLLLLDLVDTYSRMRVFDTDGTLLGEVALPGRGSVCTGYTALFNMQDTIGKASDGEVLFPFSSPVRFPSLHRLNVHTLAVEALIEPEIELDATIRDFTATSADGVQVPYRVIARADLDLAQTHPTVIYGYGGFAVALLPAWPTAQLAAWVQGGGVLVLAHLRGGSELGPDQWHSGRLANKQNSFNDVHAIAEDLLARGITCTEQLGVTGGSNGGLMAAAVAVQRPDLFRACIAHVPVTDVLGCTRDPLCFAICQLEYGSPHDPEMSEALNAWSPYQNIENGKAYPAVLLDAGKNDARCPPWHVRKMAARLQPANAGPNPILMRVREGAGHGSVGQADQRALDADFLSFFMDQLGLVS